MLCGSESTVTAACTFSACRYPRPGSAAAGGRPASRAVDLTRSNLGPAPPPQQTRSARCQCRSAPARAGPAAGAQSKAGHGRAGTVTASDSPGAWARGASGWDCGLGRSLRLQVRLGELAKLLQINEGPASEAAAAGQPQPEAYGGGRITVTAMVSIR